MGSFIILIVIVVLFFWCLKEYYEMKLGIGPQASPKQIANEITSICKDLNGSGTFLDVGSGWGSMLIPMAKALPDWTFYGIEKSPTPWLVSQFKTMKNNFGNINLFLGDAEKFRYRGYDIIYLNLPKKLINEITPPLIRNIQRGSLVVTYRNQIDGIDAYSTLTVKDDRGMERQVYLYADLEPKTTEKPVQQEQAQPEPQAKPSKPAQPQIPEAEMRIEEPVTAPDLELEPKIEDEAIVQEDADKTPPPPEKK